MLYFGKNVKGGWVEIPEFSDEKKVYRYVLYYFILLIYIYIYTINMYSYFKSLLIFS